MPRAPRPRGSHVSDNKAIIENLNEVLTAELTAINQYFLHSELCEYWGYGALHAKIRAEAIDEMRHAEQIIERILYLEGLPNVQRLGKIKIGENVAEALAADRDLEREAIPRLNAGIELCRTSGDNGTRALLEGILRNEEDHLDWIDTQIALIERVGEQNYLAAQIHPSGQG